MLKTKSAVLMGSFSLMILGSGSAAASDSISVATLHDYAPYCFLDGESLSEQEMHSGIKPGEDSTILLGYSWDILRESFHQQNYTLDLLIAPWIRAKREVDNGNVDVLFPAGKNEERSKRYYYSKESINDVKFVLYVRQDSHFEWDGFDSLSGLVIGQIHGYNFGDQWERVSDVRKIELKTIEQGFKMLNSGRIDGFAGYELNWDLTLARLGWSEKFRKLPSFGASSEHVAVLKTNPRAQEILSAFDAGKRALEKNGKLAEIQMAWKGKAQTLNEEKAEEMMP
ncbi:transporter substrate-binding domain-containing protein [Vibrio sp. Of7-15]|uniref:transporter substrate-binding domain-containing protein n=1 Tax=Vibrio sp. Of7-15 TaxID=2724879 RepID=UPI001EF3BE38|nr:transporter substrate-binding domain-containing protein [Vibrio sp. Of7-15]MCG7499435.1 transporter substrate-binding domain-containing protein [Vibrio sp. Of7-15]